MLWKSAVTLGFFLIAFVVVIGLNKLPPFEAAIGVVAWVAVSFFFGLHCGNTSFGRLRW